MFKKVILSLALLALPFKGMAAAADVDPRNAVVQAAIAASPVVEKAVNNVHAYHAAKAGELDSMISYISAQASGLSDAQWEAVITNATASLDAPISPFGELDTALKAAVDAKEFAKSDYFPLFFQRAREGLAAAKAFLSNADNVRALKEGTTPAGYSITPPPYVFTNDPATIYSDGKGSTLSTAVLHILMELKKAEGATTLHEAGTKLLGADWASRSAVVDFMPLPPAFEAPAAFKATAYYTQSGEPTAEGEAPKTGGFVAYPNNGFNLGGNHVKPSNCRDASSFVADLFGPRKPEVPYLAAVPNFKHLADRHFGVAHEWDDAEKFAAEQPVVSALAGIYEPIKEAVTIEDAEAGLLWARIGVGRYMGVVLGRDPTNAENLLILGANRDLPGLDGRGLVQSYPFKAGEWNMFFRVK